MRVLSVAKLPQFLCWPNALVSRLRMRYLDRCLWILHKGIMTPQSGDVCLVRDLVFTHLVEERGLIDKSLLNPILFTLKLSYCIWLCTLAKECKLNFSNQNSITFFSSKSPTTCRSGHMHCVSYSVLVYTSLFVSFARTSIRNADPRSIYYILRLQTDDWALYRYVAVHGLCILQCNSTF